MCVCGLCPLSGVQTLEVCKEWAVACFEKGNTVWSFSFRPCLCTWRFGWIKTMPFLAISNIFSFLTALSEWRQSQFLLAHQNKSGGNSTDLWSHLTSLNSSSSHTGMNWQQFHLHFCCCYNIKSSYSCITLGICESSYQSFTLVALWT